MTATIYSLLLVGCSTPRDENGILTR